MRYFFIVFVVCALAFSASFNGPAYSQRHTGYCDQAASTADALECVNKHNLDTQEKLSAVFKSILEGQDQETKTALSEAQRNWIIYRDAQCEWESNLTDTASLKRVYELSCLTDMTERRIKLLKSVQIREETKEPREFGAQPRWMNALAHDYPDIFWRYGEWKSIDLNCDQELEQVMTGISVARIQDSVTIGEQTLSEENHNEVSVVIAISDNPQTGRPKSKLFHFPVMNREGAEQPFLCRPAVRLEKTARSTPDDLEEQESEASCEDGLLISDRICDDYTIYWDGSEYTLEANNPEGEAL